MTHDGSGKEIKVRSKLETQISDILNNIGIDWKYEITSILYTIPETYHKYTVDFTLENGILLEGKGYLEDHAERKKYVLIKEQHPEIDIRFVFQDPNKKCGGMKTTHAQWADKCGFKWCSIKDTDQLKNWITEDHGKTSNNSRQSSKARRKA